MTTTVAQLRRYPVKSMQGEDLDMGALTERGVLGDRGYALIDAATGRVVSAKNPRKWPRLLEYHARYVPAPCPGEDLPPVEITLLDGTRVRSDAPWALECLSAALGRSVALERIPPAGQRLEEFWPAVEGLTPVGEPVANLSQGQRLPGAGQTQIRAPLAPCGAALPPSDTGRPPGGVAAPAFVPPG